MAHISELNLPTYISNPLYNSFAFDYTEEMEREFPSGFKNVQRIFSIQELINLGAEGLKKRPRIGKKAINVIAHKLIEYCNDHKIHFDLNKFLLKKETGKHVQAPDYLGSNHHGYVYALDAENMFTKIGLSKSFPIDRLKSCSTGCPYELKLAGYVQCNNRFKTEKDIQTLFKKYHKRGEWFSISYEEIKKLSDYNWIDYRGQGLDIHSTTTIPEETAGAPAPTVKTI